MNFVRKFLQILFELFDKGIVIFFLDNFNQSIKVFAVGNQIFIFLYFIL